MRARFSPLSSRGIGLIGALVALAIMAVGAGTVAVILRAEMEQKQHLVAQTQRASYTTFQAEVALEGIDPTRIINPLAAVANINPNGDPQSGTAPLGTMGSSQGSWNSGSGSSGTGTVTITPITPVQDRSGGGTGIVTTTDGPDPTENLSSTLLAPVVALSSTTLQASSFPATGWFTFPQNPPGTVYRYTTDGSTPSDGSPIWNYASASAITVANFPAQIRVRAFHSSSTYAPSSTTVLAPLAYQLSAVTFGRSEAPAIGPAVFSYAEQFGVPGNGITLSGDEAILGANFTIYYTTDGSDPAVAGTRVAYTGAFKIPVTHWSWDGIDGTPATAIVRAIAVGSDGRYLTSLATQQAFTNVAITLDPPSFNLAEIAEGYAPGTQLVFSHSLGGNVIIVYGWWSDESISRVANGAITL